MSGIKAFAPATVSNLACGFDILGLAIDGPGDEVIVHKKIGPGVNIVAIHGDHGKLPRDSDKNCASISASAVLKALGVDFGLNMEIRKKMPFGSGLGSSAASAVAGAVAANAICGNRLSKMELLPLAYEGEKIASGEIVHLDNIAPSLLGGITLNRSNKDFEVHRLYFPEGLHIAVIYPHVEILTKESRGSLSDTVTLQQHVEQSSNLAGLITGLLTSNFELIGNSLNDVIIEPQRAQYIPGFYDLKDAALKSGALGCSISGSGPSVFALCNGSNAAELSAASMISILDKLGIRSEIFISPINSNGAIIC